jgi:hypothetical protein
MQAKKRAKSVKFGKESVKKEIKETKAPEEVKAPVVEQEVEEVKPVAEDSPNAEEIKQEIAAKISSKTEETQEPIEVDLTTETPVEQEEVSVPETPAETVVEDKPAPFGSFTKNFDEPEPKKSNLGFFLMVVLVTFIVGVLAIGGFYYFSNKTTLNPTPTPTPTVSPTAIPSPTAESVDLSSSTIEVLNGSGVSGVAAKVKSQLTDAGFTVSSVGNAETSDFTNTIISAKDKVDKAFIDALIKELEKSYKVEAKVNSLSDSNDTDVVVTVGTSTSN